MDNTIKKYYDGYDDSNSLFVPLPLLPVKFNSAVDIVKKKPKEE